MYCFFDLSFFNNLLIIRVWELRGDLLAERVEFDELFAERGDLCHAAAI